MGRTYPDLESIVLLSDLYNISLDELLREDSDIIKKLSLDSKLKRQFKFIIISLIVIITVVGFYIFKYSSTSGGNTEIYLDKIQISDMNIKKVEQDDADTELNFNVKSNSLFYGLSKEESNNNTLIYVGSDGSIHIVIDTVFDSLSLVSNRKIKTSNTIKLPKNYSEDTKVILNSKIKSGETRVIGTISDLLISDKNN